MYNVLSQLTIQPQHVAAFITLIRDHARESLRDEVGTLGFEVIQDEADPTHFYVHETYTDAAAFQAHMQGAIGARNFPRIAALVSGKLDSSVFIGKGVTIFPAET
jgi:(4S)-4-hydroxy-5-phosphonooxypentane-2,3-dione isomerase